MRPGGTTIVLQQTEQRVGIGHGAIGGIKTTRGIRGDVMPPICDYALTVASSGKVRYNAIGDSQRCIVEDSMTKICNVVGQCAIQDINTTPVFEDTAIIC